MKLLERLRQLCGLDLPRNLQVTSLSLDDIDEVDDLPTLPVTEEVNLPQTRSEPCKPLRLLIITTGTRGDVEPHLALAMGCVRAGHKVCIATHEKYHEFITCRGVSHRPVACASIKTEVDRKTLKIKRQFYSHEQQHKDITSAIGEEKPDYVLLNCLNMDTFRTCKELGIKAIGLFYVPHTRTYEFPHPHVSTLPGGLYNLPLNRHRPLTSSLLQLERGVESNVAVGEENDRSAHTSNAMLTWVAMEEQSAHSREEDDPVAAKVPENAVFGDMGWFQSLKLPILYGFSDIVRPRPADWPRWNYVTGFWKLPVHEDWNPPSSLTNFLACGSPPVYVGYGSISVEDSTHPFSGRNNAEDLEMVSRVLRQLGMRGIFCASNKERGPASGNASSAAGEMVEKR